ncbi:MAG: hypothetical protein AAGE52_05560 [Myxococcota bacterium]
MTDDDLEPTEEDEQSEARSVVGGGTREDSLPEEGGLGGGLGIDLPANEEELREAAALARALERGTAEEPPEDALQMAALLSFSHDEGALDPDRSAAILEDVFKEARVRRPEKAPWWRWLIPVGVAGAAAAVAVIFVMKPAPPSGPMALPTPGSELLQAQAAAASGAATKLDSEMEDYRSTVLAALEDRYR